MSGGNDSVVPDQATRPAARGFLQLASSRAVSTALLFVAFAVTASHLGPSGLGIYAFGLATLTIFQNLSDFGFQATVNRDISQEPEREAVLLPNVAYLRVACGAIAYGAMVGLLILGGYSPDERAAAMVAGILLVTLAFESARIPFEVRLRVAWPATVEAGEAALLAGGTVLLAARGSGPLAFLWLYVAVNTLTELLILPGALRVATSLQWRPRPETLTRIARIAWPIGLMNLIATVYYGVDTLILAQFHSSAAVGQYGAAYRVLTTIGVIPAMIMVVVRPVLSRSGAESRLLLQRRVKRIARLLLVLAIPIAIGGGMTAWRAFSAIPGFSHYQSGGVALAILAPAAGIIFLAGLTQAVLLAAHRERSLIGISVFSLALTLALCFALIPPFSLVGAAVATTLTELAVLAVSLWVSRRLVGVTTFERTMWRLLGPSAVLVVALGLGYVLPPFVQIAVGAIAYLIALPAFGAVTWRDLAGLTDPDGPVAVVPTRADAVAAAVTVAEDGSAKTPVLVLRRGLEVPMRPPGALSVRRIESERFGELRHALSGISACRVVGDGAGQRSRIALAARLAGCPIVSGVPAETPATRRQGVQRWIWRALADSSDPGA